MRRLKPFFIAFCAVALISAVIFGTVAYLTDTSGVVNTFSVGSVDIYLDEAVVDKDGNPIGGRTEQGNEYHLLPGRTYTKDPTLTVAKGSEECYVRMLVTINCYSELKTIFGNSFLPQYFVEGWDSTVWVSTEAIAENQTENTATYEFRYYKTVKPTSNSDEVLDALFDSIVVPGNLTKEQLATIENFEIVVEGHAIQAAGFADANAAWNAFKK